MTDMAAELRATSDALLRDLDALVALEEEKRTLPPSDPRLVELAAHVHEIARRVLGHTGMQRRLSAAVAAGPAADLPIEAIRRSPAVVLAEWRDVEQRLRQAESGSAQLAELQILAQRLRDEYQQAFDETPLGDLPRP